MIRSAAVVPHPPLLVPELMGSAAAEAEPLRTACQQAVRGLRGRRWLAVGVHADGPATVPSGTGGNFRGYGVDVPITLGPNGSGGFGAAAAGGLPLPLLVAGWLSRDGAADAVVGELLHPATPAAECVARGRELATDDGDWSLLVLADGANTHPAPGAGRVDVRATGFDAAVAAALAAADTATLAGLDERLAVELGAAGRAPLQVLAGAAQGTRWSAELLYSGAPYGVGYHVALWQALP